MNEPKSSKFKVNLKVAECFLSTRLRIINIISFKNTGRCVGLVITPSLPVAASDTEYFGGLVERWGRCVKTIKWGT